MFTIGNVGIGGKYVHVLDDTSLESVLTTLDTVQDFLRYLIKKEESVTSGLLSGADGEEQLLACYLQSGTPEKGHDFVFTTPPGSSVYLGPNWWPDFIRSDHRNRQVEADRASYAWDAMIERVAQSFQGSTRPRLDYRARERAVTILGRETRFRRRVLAKTYSELALMAPPLTLLTRSVLPTSIGEPFYIFMSSPSHIMKEADPVAKRRQLLELVCLSAVHRNRDQRDVIGIAPCVLTPEEPEDVMYIGTEHYDADDWNQAEQAHALLSSLGPATPSVSTERAREYPSEE
jgi:hypothetical protein